MNKKSIIIISILSLIVIGLIGGIIYIKNYYIKQLDYIFYTNADESEEREYDCSFTNTHKIIQILDYHFAMDGVSYAIVDDFQSYQPYIVVIPKDMETKLEKDKYYEFTYKLNGKGIIKDFNDLNSYLIGTLNNKSRGNDSVGTIYVDLEIKETDSQQNYMKRIGGTYTVKYDEGGLEVFYWSIPSKTDTLYHTNYPVFCIHYVGKDYPGEPYAYEVGSTTLKLRHLGRNNTDPVSETLIYKRIK